MQSECSLKKFHLSIDILYVGSEISEFRISLLLFLKGKKVTF